MLDLLKNLLGARPLANPARLDAPSLEHLTNDLKRLEKLSPELPQRTLRYVVDGEDHTVLERLSGSGAAQVLELICTQQFHISDSITDRRQFFRTVSVTDPQLFIRLGKVYEAAAQGVIRHQYQAFGDASLTWLELLLIEATSFSPNVWPHRCRPCAALDAAMVEAMLVASGHLADLLVRSAFQPTLTPYVGAPLEAVFLSLRGLNDCAVNHKPALVAAINHLELSQRLYALDMMQRAKVPPEPFMEGLLDLAIGSSKQARQRAQSILAPIKSTTRSSLERRIIQGETETRSEAVRLLWTWENENARPFLTTRLSQEKGKVQRVIEEVLAVAPPASADDTPQDLPPLKPIKLEEPLGVETKAAWEQCFQKINTAINQAAPGQHIHQREMKPIDMDTVSKAFLQLQGGPADRHLLGRFAHAWWFKEIAQPVKEFWHRPELQLVHLARFLRLIGEIGKARDDERFMVGYGGWSESLFPIFRRSHPEAGLREFAAGLTAVGVAGSRIGRGLLFNYHEIPSPFGLPPALIWPYWAEHLDLLENAYAAPAGDFMERYHQRYARRNAFNAIAMFPKTPARLIPVLWSLALGPKSERPAAQRCLSGLSDKFERLVSALSAGDRESRAAAAEWMGRLRDERGINELLAALKREKHDVVKGAIMTALELLGASVDQFLDRKALLKEAEKGLAKGLPEDLKWFPFEQLPPVRWSDNEKRVDPVIITWWLVQGVKLKSPEPSVLLRRYCACLVPADREALGQFVLDAWLARDTSPRTGEDAEKEAMKRAHAAVQAAQHWAQYIKQNPQMAQSFASYAQQKTLEEHYAEILPVVQREPTGSAIASKGVLALAGACVGSGAATVINRYLKDWYGMRSAQCRALLQMLAWVEHNTATQLLLAVGSRFRTKGIQEEANKQAQLLAERKGWTVAELADRTIPTAGLDENGVMTLDYGRRTFTARLDEDLAFVLADREGKALKSLPEPRQDDDEALAALAKKTFSAAKKELKSVLSLQRERLYEAMCTERTWSYEDWSMYLNNHPIVRYHCQRLVWGVVQDGGLAQLFRPLADGTLTNAADDPVTLTPEDQVRIAHECQITSEQSKAWRDHLKDYDVAPLFEQFGRPNFTLPDGHLHEDELTDFRGHLLEAFKLRGRATKLGYTRGQAQDGGWFYEYRKRFATLGIEGVVVFTGNSLPEENRTIGLMAFHFERVSPDVSQATNAAKMSLSEVPAVLLSECWNDFRQLAADGTGFDPDWENKTGL